MCFGSFIKSASLYEKQDRIILEGNVDGNLGAQGTGPERARDKHETDEGDISEWPCPVHGVDGEHILPPHLHGANIASGSISEFVRDVRQRRLPVSDLLAPFRCPADAAYAARPSHSPHTTANTADGTLGETRIEKEVVVSLRPPLMPLQVRVLARASS